MAIRFTARSVLKLVAFALVIATGATQSGCVYWNTMYNAKKHFKEAEKQNNPELGGTKMTANRRLYEDAIAKAGKVVQKHPKSKYHDDALYLIGVSYFRIDNYAKSESAFRELLAVHPKSEFVEESQLYLARCRMQSGDEQAAYRTFTELATTARKPEWRSEATFQRGMYLSEIASYDSAVAAFQQILDEYPDTDRANEARILAADQLRKLNRPTEAMELYTPLTTHKEPLVRYPALIGLGGACYEAQLVDSGIAIFEAMTEEELYADSIGNIRLLLGDGLERSGDVDGAWRQYEQVAAALERTRWSAEAYFNMAEIKQYDQGDLASAKEHYDKVREEYASGDLSNEALTRSANISKLEQFRKSLGRGELTRGPVGDSTRIYDPEDLPRYERALKSSPLEARPYDFVHSSVRSKDLEDSLARSSATAVASGQSALSESQPAYGPETPPELKSIWDDPGRFGPQTPPEFVVYDTASGLAGSGEDSPSDDDSTAADSSGLAGAFGPPVDSLELILNLRAEELLSGEAWERILEADSLYGPPSPASSYDFGVGAMYGPGTPTEIFWAQAEVPEVDSTAIREREARAAMRKERESAFAEIETAAETQMQLAELYRFDLNYPDSALAEYNDIAERYKGTPYGAQALLAAADIYTSEYNDSTNARQRLIRILSEYPHLDYAGDAIGRLGWRGSDADTAHPMAAYSAAEDRYLYDNDPAAAIDEFRAFVEKYPYSRLVPRAEYAIAALTDRYFPAEDSSVVWAYQEIAATYAQSDLAMAATQRLSATVPRPKPRAVPVADKKETGKPGESGKTPGSEEESGYASLPIAPRPKVIGQVEFPSADVGSITKEVVVVYRIVIDYSGAISEYELIQKSPSEDLDEATRRAILETKFDPDSIAPESLNIPYRYEIRVTPPALSPDELDWYNRTGGQPNIPGQP